MDPVMVDVALGFRVRDGQIQYLEDGSITRVRPASTEEIRMYRSLVIGHSGWPVQDTDLVS